jgi:Skp family chaperone for outer membrane proteins
VKKIHIIAFGLIATLSAACSPPSPIGLVDVGRIAANWPEYQNDQRQFQTDEQVLATSKASNKLKARQDFILRAKYAAITDRLTEQIRSAATKVAQQQNLKLVVTHEGVGYGGTDITKDVEKALDITTETVTPSP